jgi:hypothetical protein
MSADLVLYTFKEEDSELVESLYMKSQANTLGSKYFTWDAIVAATDNSLDALFDLFEVVSDRCWIGEVSWLKATLLDDDESFIPDLVGFVSELIGEEFPVITDELISKVNDFSFESHEHYSNISKEDLINFLEKNKGYKTFTLSE